MVCSECSSEHRVNYEVNSLGVTVWDRYKATKDVRLPQYISPSLTKFPFTDETLRMQIWTGYFPPRVHTFDYTTSLNIHIIVGISK